MDRPPVIGVSSSEIRTPERLKEIPEGEPLQHEVCLGMPYLHAVQQVGAVPVIVAPLKAGAIDTLLDTVDALCLSGGPDLDPKTYDRSPDPNLGPTELAIDKFELALAKGAYARGMPILAICRGAQLINVARGGTLFQHIPNEPGASLEHRQNQLGHYRTHAVEVLPNTLLGATLGESSLQVNSFHHQAIDRLGKGLRVAARSEDGIVEGIESTEHDFVIGVQWHAESLTDGPEHEALFAALVEAGVRYRDGSSRAKVSAV